MCNPAVVPMALVGMQTIQSIQTQQARIAQDKQQTQLANEEAQQRAAAIRAQARSQMASGRVRLAASSVAPEGSPADVLASEAAGDELNAQTALWRGALHPGLTPGGELSTALPAATRAISATNRLYR